MRRFVFASIVTLLVATSARATPLAQPGPYGIGVRTVVLVDTTRPTEKYGPYEGSPERELVVEVWYPADTDAGSTAVRDAAPRGTGGPWPLVLRAHGLGGKRNDAAYLTTFLASHGYIVAAPDFPLSKRDTPAIVPTIYDIDQQPLDLAFVADRVLGATDATAFLEGIVDGARIASVGHSLGGLTVLLHAFSEELGDSRVRAVAALAPWACPLQQEFFSRAVPSLWMGGTADLVTPYAENQLAVFDRAPAPKTLVTLELGTHIDFSTAPFEVEREDEGRSPDDIFCDATFGLVGLRPLRAPKLPVEMGHEPEVDQGTCGEICPDYEGDWMGEDRQHEITRAAVLAFLDAELGGDASAREVLVATLDAEPDVEVVDVDDACGFASCSVAGSECIVCGRPVSGSGASDDATVTDALFILRAAVGSEACAPCACDVNASSDVTSTDAVAVLRRAVGLEQQLRCLRAAP
jgi:predicted dienelactone hydrolase